MKQLKSTGQSEDTLNEDLPEAQQQAEDDVNGGIRIGQYSNATYHKDGLFSTIYRAVAPGGHIVALKLTNPSAMHPPHNSEREARILRDSLAPHIIPLLDEFHIAGGYLVLVFPYQPTDLAQSLSAGSLSHAEKKTCLHGLFDALSHIHAKGIIHRDVKPSNILLDRSGGHSYLADFGIAWSPRDQSLESVQRKITDVGSTAYRPPELLFGHTAYDESLDMWAAGCVMGEAVTSTRSTLFDPGPLGSELALIKSIFSSLGTPTNETWPVCYLQHSFQRMITDEFKGGDQFSRLGKDAFS